MKNIKISFLCLLVLCTTLGCNSSTKSNSITAKKTYINPQFSEYITSYPNNRLSRKSEIKVTFKQEVPKAKQKEDLILFTPKIVGKGHWTNAYSYVYTPSEVLPSYTTYQATIDLNSLFIIESESLKAFKFSFSTFKQRVLILSTHLEPIDKNNPEQQILTGNLNTEDYEDFNHLKELFSATQSGKDLPISWDKNIHKNTHKFTIKGIFRKEELSEVLLTFKGSSLDINDINKNISVPSLGSFNITNHNIDYVKKRMILTFSDALNPKQNLDGLITIDGLESPTFFTDNNTLNISYNKHTKEHASITIHGAIQNINGYRLNKELKLELDFEQAKPIIKSKRNVNTIMPSSQRGIFPVEAIGVNTLRVRILQVFNDNIVQYFQNNNLGGEYRLNHVGRVVKEYMVDLTQESNYDPLHLTTYNLRVDQTFEQAPNALYLVTVLFNQSDIEYTCTKGSDQGNSWENRENPCHPYYYTKYDSPTSTKHFFLISDLGIIAKEGENQQINIYVTNLLTTEPEADATVAFYDFQQQLIHSSSTNSDGMVSFLYDTRPYMVIVSKNEQQSMMNLNYDRALTTSEFNVNGKKVPEGIKGYLYTERGVWRPGDTIYLSLILEDQKKTLPKEHPIELELYNPRGQLVKKHIYTYGVQGVYALTTSTSEDAKTGQWMAQVKVGNQVFNKPLKIETVKPNRLKADVHFDTDEILKSDKKVYGALTVSWLHGAVGKNLEAEYDLKLTPTHTRFSEYENYIFDYTSKEQQPYREAVFRGKTDSQGKAEIALDLNQIEQPRGKLKATLTGKVFETGGDFSVDFKSFIYSPYNSYVGIAPFRFKSGQRYLHTNKKQTLRFVNVDQQGNPLPNTKLKVELIELNWRWWWDNSYNSVSTYMLGESSRIKNSLTLTTDAKGRASWDIRVPNRDWGRYYLRVTDKASGHIAGQIVLFDWADWTSRKNDNSSSESLLYFGTDKPSYKVGELVNVNLPKTPKGRTLVSIENGTSILDQFWLETKVGQTQFSFKVTENMSPNVYIHLTQIQPYPNSNSLPIRLYGVVPITVVNPNSTLNPIINMPDVLRPNKPASISISEQSGKPMTYTIALVDEGLLDLTNFKTPKPKDLFYSKEALGVRTWDMYNDIVAPHEQEYMNQLISVGGDDQGHDGDTYRKESRFKPVVKYLGPFSIQANETKAHTIPIPSYIGSVRTMVIAANTHNKAYGQAEKIVPVKEPLMILATLPRVTGPGETIDVPVSVFLEDHKLSEVSLSIKTTGGFITKGEKTNTLSFESNGEKLGMFTIQSKNIIGNGSVTIQASAGSYTANQTIHLDIRPSNPMVHQVETKAIPAHSDWTSKTTSDGLKGSNSSVLELSYLPSIHLKRRLNYLIRYPHGCIEQTTSSVFAQLFLDQFIDLSDQQRGEIDKNINAAITRIQTFQTNEGGFTYWQGSTYPSNWGTSYATHFLILAREKGYYVPSEMYDNVIDYQKQQANEWNISKYRHRNLAHTYRLYTLALAGEPLSSAMNRTKQEIHKLDKISRWKLASAYALLDLTQESNEIISGVGKDLDDYLDLSNTFGSTIRDKALILETLTLLNQKQEALDIVKFIASRLGNKSYWMSTQTTAYSLIALASYLGTEKTPKTLSVAYTINGERKELSTKNNILSIPLGTELSGKIVVENLNNATLFTELTNSGIPSVGNEKAYSHRIQLDVDFYDEEGGPISVTQMEQGTNFSAEVTVSNLSLSTDYKEIAVEQIFPSGWEIINDRVQAQDPSDTSNEYTYQDIKDDRIYTYMNLGANESKTFTIHLNATYRGEFYLPAHKAYTMYNNKISTLIPGKWIEIE